MDKFWFARPVPVQGEALLDKAWKFGDSVLTDDEDELLTKIAGVAPGYPEAFATQAARNVALGPHGTYIEFIPTSWREMKFAGFSVSSIAIGHDVGEPGFEQIAPPVLDAVAERLKNVNSAEIVVRRMRHLVRLATDGTIMVSGGMPEFEVARDVEGSMRTAEYLQSELTSRLKSTATV